MKLDSSLPWPILRFSVFVAAIIVLVNEATPTIVQDTWSSERRSIIEDSEVGYTLMPHSGSLRWRRKDSPPDQHDFSMVSWKGTICGRITNEWAGKESEVALILRPSREDYLKLWQVLLELDVWSLRSPMEILKGIKSAEEDPYRDWTTSRDNYRFRFRIGKKEHHFDAYYVEGLKDRRYERILTEINRVLEKGGWVRI